MRVFQRLGTLYREHGALPVGVGRVSGVIAHSLAVLCLLGVVAFHFPEYLTTPELRQRYSVEVLRGVMLVALLLSGGVALANLLLGRTRWLNACTLAILAAAMLLGGPTVPVGEFPDGTAYIGLDWFILDLLGSALGFIVLEKLLPMRGSQPVFRAEWLTDVVHFAINHFLIGLALFLINFFVHRLFGELVHAPLQAAVQALPWAVEMLLCVLVADLAQYAIHRAYHQLPFLWRFHAIHHSTKTLDWLAGSRQHFLETVLTRTVVLGSLFVFGFSRGVMDVYILIVGVQAVLNHSNVKLPWGPLKHVLVTPEFHHWHHSSERLALDRNYAVHFSFIDRVLGTAVKSDRALPEKYGVLGEYMPEGFLRQQAFPFTWRGQ